MKYLIITTLMILDLSTAKADVNISLPLLKRDLGDMIEVKSNKEIWFCPDNTCDIYKIGKPHSDLSTFIYLHLFHESGYIYLKESISGSRAFRKLAVEEPKVRAKVTQYCLTEIKTPSCILKNMKKELGVTIGFGRYDEGYFCYGYRENENICKKL